MITMISMISMIVWIVIWSLILLKFIAEGDAWGALISFCALLTFPIWPITVLYYVYVRGRQY